MYYDQKGVKVFMDPFSKRIETVQEKMRQEGCRYLILSPSTNMFYFTGLQTTADERLQAIVIPAEGQPTAILPEMYKEKAKAVITGRFPLISWSDQQDPFELLKQTVREGNDGRIAVDDFMRAGHLIEIMHACPGFTFVQASGIVDSLRLFKDENEIMLMESAGSFADQVMEKVQSEIRPGINEKELAHFIETSFKQICDDISFQAIVASGPNSASPHHSPGNRQLKEGDFVVVDCGGSVEGYCSDITRTFCLGKADDEMKKVYRAVQEANEAAFQAVGRSCSGEEADAAARGVIAAAGYEDYFIHRTGHGIGLDVHEPPYLVEGNSEKILPGMAFSIEPGIYLPGRYGVRIEDIVAVIDHAPRRLNRFTRDLLEL